MKDIYKNPTLYYIAVPAIIGLWPLLVWAVYLPQAKRSFDEWQTDYNKAKKTMKEILDLDDSRLDLDSSKAGAAEFDYARVVDSVARFCQISPSNYDLSSKPIKPSKGKKSQSCRVTLKQIDIAAFAKFLSEIQLRWANLQCEDVTLTKTQGLPDAWKVELDFQYYYKGGS